MTAVIRYVVGSRNPLTHLFDVQMTIEQPAALQLVSLPAWIPGSYMIREFAKHLQGLTARQGRKACVLAQLNKHTWSVTCQPGRPLPHGLSQAGSPGFAAFHKAKSPLDRFFAAASPPSPC